MLSSSESPAVPSPLVSVKARPSPPPPSGLDMLTVKPLAVPVERPVEHQLVTGRGETWTTEALTGSSRPG